MKKKIWFIFLISLIANFLYASDYYVIEDTNVFTYTNRVRDYITKNTKIDVRSVYCSSIYDGTYLAEIYDGKYIRLDNVVNKSLTTYLPDEFLASHSYEKGLYLFPSYVIDAVKKQDRNYLKNFESKNISRMTVDDGDWGTTYWYDRSFETQLISNIALRLGSFYGLTTFFITNIEKIDNQTYLVSTNNLKVNNPAYLMQDYLFSDLFDKENVNFILKKDGDYLYVYVEDEINPRETYCYVDNNFRVELEKLLKNNVCDTGKITWPRHANGTSDYDGSSSVKQTSLPLTNVAPNKEMTVSENLKLRSAEATSSTVLTVMAAGTKVKVLELGKAETIDGINSNWVKVEIISGKDRNGNTIRQGTIGWCYGGYLK